MLPEPRYAEWKPVAVRRWPTAWVGFTAGALLVLLFWVATRTFQYAVIMLAALLGRFVTSFLVRRQLATLRDDPTGGQYATTIRLFRGVTYGFDEGLLAFEDGWLVYSGRRTTFSLPASAVRIRLIDKSSLSFAFGPPEDERTIFVTVEKADRFLAEATGGWQNRSDVEGDSIVYPPLKPDATAYATVGSMLSFAIIVTALALGVIALSPSAKNNLAFLLLGLGWVGMSVYLLEAKRGLRRLEAGLPRELPVWRRIFAPPKERNVLPPSSPTGSL